MRNGFSSAIKTASADEARALLVAAQTENRNLPDAILLDLDLGSENGFDFLRARYETPRWMEIPLVVWTKLGDHNEQICGIFKVQAYVPKSKGEPGLSEALENIVRQQSQKN